MIYGMTSRAPWSGNPKPFWELWDQFGIEKAQMLPYWTPDAPISAGNQKIKATSYVRKGQKTLLVLASWAEDTKEVRPQIDWDAIGIDREHVVLRAPEIGDLQDADVYEIGEPVTIEPAEGKILVIEEK